MILIANNLNDYLHRYSADGLSNNNQTNLAIKGIIAIKAMSQMSLSVNKTTDFEKYSKTSSQHYAQWKSLALTGDQHLLGVYGQIGSWTLGYNLFPDVWLNTSVIESSVYNGQSSFIYNFSLALGSSEENVPVDNLDPFSKNSPALVAGWNLFVAAMTPNQDICTHLISRIYNSPVFFFSAPDPVLGAAYAPLALKVPVKLTANPAPTSKSHTSVISGGIIRGILGGVAALLVIVAFALVVWRRRRQSHRHTSVGLSSLGEIMSQGTQATVTPFNPTGSTLNGVAPLDTGPQTNSQQRLVHHPPLEDSPLPLRRVVSVPVGLSSKELARLRSLANGSRFQPMDRRPSNPPVTSTNNGSALGVAAAAATSSSEARILRSEVNVMRHEIMHEIHRLHEEISESPPSYASGAA
ncbi:hypothetical protein BJY52DRAFT_1228070 [Lactarius psammicola]|nr:hypothetical protein BJY52DRAFT_1228070 [Lactarius psammicola]